MLPGLAALLALLAVFPAVAQSSPPPVPDITDCRTAWGRNRWFCDSPTLRAVEVEVARLVRAAEDAGPMWVGIRSEFEGWKGRHRRESSTSIDLHRAYQDLAGEMHRRAGAITAFLATETTREDLAGRCATPPDLTFATFLLDCRVDEVAGVAPGLIVQRQAWVARGAVRDPAIDHVVSAVVLASQERSPEGLSWRPVAWAGGGGTVSIPVFSEGPHGTFLTIPITSGGSGAYSSDVVLRRTGDGTWREMEAESWRAEVDRRIPRPLIAKGYSSLDLANLSVQMTLARPGDTNAEPTGGTADVRLAIRDGALVVDGITLRPTPRPAQRPPQASRR